ncbi:hypothetical protein B0H19DRAFT_1225651 [Mycena capillaripes]|nr:hypothetical protein B0H19DRAFT_1225651 [Mycena capillaripes]
MTSARAAPRCRTLSLLALSTLQLGPFSKDGRLASCSILSSSGVSQETNTIQQWLGGPLPQLESPVCTGGQWWVILLRTINITQRTETRLQTTKISPLRLQKGHRAPLESEEGRPILPGGHQVRGSGISKISYKLSNTSSSEFLGLPSNLSLAPSKRRGTATSPSPSIMSSAFASKLGTNYCPQDEELAQINSLLIEPSLRLKRLDDEIASLQTAIDKLMEERDTLSTYMEAHRALTSPLRRLPLDIIQEIFLACLPTHRNCAMSALEAPVILGRICSSWRTISLSMPRLWSRLHIVEPARPYGSWNPGLYEAKVAQRLEVAHAWLGRSGTCPLSISLEGPHDHDMTPPLTPTPPSITDLFSNVLVPFASRWQHIRLALPPLSVEATLSRLTENDVPLLNSLKIIQRPNHPNSNPDGTRWSLSQSGVLHGPSLSRFSVTGNDTNASTFPLRWNQLTTLSLMGPTWAMTQPQTCQVVLDILSRCPQLRICKVFVQSPVEALLTDSVVECPLLHILLLNCSLNTSGSLLSRLSLPDLRDFILRGHIDHSGSPSTMDSLVSFFAASPHLESISIESHAFLKPTLKEFLRGLPPTIRRLQIIEPLNMWNPFLGPLDDDAFAALELSLDRPIHCPALQELVIVNCRQVSDEALLRFITSRVPTLRLVNIKFDRAMEVDILPSLQSFMEAGLKTSIFYLPTAAPQFSPWLGLPDAPPDAD